MSTSLARALPPVSQLGALSAPSSGRVNRVRYVARGPATIVAARSSRPVPSQRIVSRRVPGGTAWYYVVQEGDTLQKIAQYFQRPVYETLRLLPLNPTIARTRSPSGWTVGLALQAGQAIRVPWIWVNKDKLQALRARRGGALAGMLGGLFDDEPDNTPPADEPGGSPDPGADPGTEPDPGTDPADQYGYLLNNGAVSSLIAASEGGQSADAFASALSPGMAATLLGLCSVLTIGLTILLNPIVGAFATAVCAYLQANPPSGTYANPGGGNQPGPGQPGGGGTTTPTTCDPGTHFDDWLGRCVADLYEKATPDKKGHYGEFGEVIPCPTGFLWDEAGKVCNPAPAGGGGSSGGGGSPGGGGTVPVKPGPGGTPPGGGGTTIPPKPGPGGGNLPAKAAPPAPGFFSTTAGKIVIGAGVIALGAGAAAYANKHPRR